MKPVIALLGPGEIEKREGLSGLLKGLDSKSVYTYYPGETEVSAIFSECLQDSLFSASKTILVKNIGMFKEKQKKSFEEALDSYLDNINDNVTLILTSEELPAGLMKKIRDKGEILQFKKMYRNDLALYVNKRLDAEGINYDRDLPDFIVTLANEDEWDTENMLESILYFSESGKPVSISDARSFLSRSGNMDIFDLVDGIFEKNPVKAALALADLRREGEPVTHMIYMIMRSAKMLWTYLSNGESHLKAYELKIMKDYSKRCDLRFVSRIFSLAGKLELMAKTMKDDFSFIELETFIYTI
jgi:DNA polymerase III delta subunit